MNTAWKVSRYGPEIIPYLDTFHEVETVVLEWIGKKLKYISVCTTFGSVCTFGSEQVQSHQHLVTLKAAQLTAANPTESCTLFQKPGDISFSGKA